MNNLMKSTITLIESIEWCSKEHGKLLRDIRNYIAEKVALTLK